MGVDPREIARLNDLFRQTFIGGKVMMTQGVASLSEETRAKVFDAVRTFTPFTEDNDPYNEHDFGLFEVEGTLFFFKLDYYDNTLEYGSENPADPTVTTRVLTIMLASEY
ncbi:MAG: DUF3768 domain-containing protein [Rhodospirillales bacterium]|nr:DUF3768 domain-containing protein [Rhodospirillales bacterium]